MKATQTSVVGAAPAVVLVNGDDGSQDKPVTCWVHPATGTVFLGGADCDATRGFPVASTDAPLKVALIGEKLYAFTSTTAVVNVLRDSA